MIIIPPDELAPDTLRSLIEEFITRHGAVHGQHEVPLEKQIEQVHRQLKTGKAQIVFDEQEETVTIIAKEKQR